jgi:hypothetical protein
LTLSGIILYEIFGRSGPYNNSFFEVEEIIARVINPEPGCALMRPDVEIFKGLDPDFQCPDYVMGES